MHKFVRLAVVGLCCAAPVAARAESMFDFENVAAGTALPFAMSVNGLTASFNGNAAVCSSAGLSGSMFVALTGNALMQGFCAPGSTPTYGPVVISFSSPLQKVSFALAINGTTSAPVTVTFLDHGTAVATQTVNPTAPNGGTGSPEVPVTYTGTFDSISVASSALLAIDNLDAVPYPQFPSSPVH